MFLKKHIKHYKQYFKNVIIITHICFYVNDCEKIYIYIKLNLISVLDSPF